MRSDYVAATGTHPPLLHGKGYEVLHGELGEDPQPKAYNSMANGSGAYVQRICNCVLRFLGLLVDASLLKVLRRVSEVPF